MRLITSIGSMLIVAAVAFSLRADYTVVSIGFWVLFAVLFGFRLYRFARDWGPWSDNQYVADFVERQVPALKERSYLVLDTSPKPSFLRDRALRATADILTQIPIARLVSSASFWKAARATLMMVVVFGVAESQLPISPTSTWRSLYNQNQYAAEQIKDAVIDEDVSVTIGDIQVRYDFPEYTRMTPITIPNSNGEVHAPQGTKISIKARTLERFEAVQIEINGVRQPATLNFGREVVAEFELNTEGTYRFLFFDGERQLPSQEFAMVFDEDDPPVASLEIKRTQIPSNRSVSITWNATDDFGLERVVLEVTSGGKTRDIMLRKPKENRLKLGAKIRRSIEELGLKGGDTATLRLVAYDNQAPLNQTQSTAEGEPFGKMGVSEPIEIQILTPQLSAEQMKQLNKKLRTELVLIVAEYLVEATPTQVNVYNWSQSAMKRYDAIKSVTDEAWSDGWPTYLSAELIAKVYSDSASMFRFVRTTYSSDRLGDPKPEDLEYFTEAYTKHIAQLEQTIFIIDRMLRQVAFREVGQSSKSLTRSAQRFSEIDFSSKSKQELLNSLSRIQKDLQKIDDAVEDLNGYLLKEFVEDRSVEISKMQSVLRDQLAAENLDAARNTTEQFSQSVNQFAEGVSEILERMKAEEDEMEQEMESLIEKLEELDERQRAQMEELAQARQNDPVAQELASLWKEIEAQAVLARDSSQRIVEGIRDGRGFRYTSIRHLERLGEKMTSLYGSVVTRNLEDVSDTLMSSGMRLKRVENVLSNESTRSRTALDPVPTTLSAMEQEYSVVVKALLRIQELLESETLSKAQSNPQLMEAAQDMALRQAQLQQEMMGLLPKVQEMEQQMPTATGEATDFAMQAGKSMDDAKQFLEGGMAMAGESLQFQSSARIQDTIEALKQAAAQMQQMQQQTEQMAGGGEGDSEMMSSDVEIPPVKPRVSPEEYRKMLLEGMQGGVPQEYETLKKKYYEELVAQ